MIRRASTITVIITHFDSFIVLADGRTTIEFSARFR
jgi:hypothetical protein